MCEDLPIPSSILSPSLLIWSFILLKVSNVTFFHWCHLTGKDSNYFSHFPLSLTNPTSFFIQTIVDKIYWNNVRFYNFIWTTPLLPPIQCCLDVFSFKMPTNIVSGVKGGGADVRVRRTEIITKKSTLFQIFCPGLSGKNIDLLDFACEQWTLYNV